MAEPEGVAFRERALGGAGAGNPLEQLDRLLRLASRRTWAAVTALGLLVAALIGWGVIAQRSVTVVASDMLVPPNGFVEVGRLESGIVVQVRVAADDQVRAGEVMATYRPTGVAGSAVAEIVAPVDGLVIEVAVAAGAPLVPGLPAFTIEPAPFDIVAIAFASPDVHAQIDVGYRVSVQALSAPAAQYGSIVGYIVEISDTPATAARLDRLAGGNQELARAFLAGGPVYEVLINLERQILDHDPVLSPAQVHGDHGTDVRVDGAGPHLGVMWQRVVGLLRATHAKDRAGIASATDDLATNHDLTKVIKALGLAASTLADSLAEANRHPVGEILDDLEDGLEPASVA
ncbi:MAG: HlyD family efflux transporter periplasmic adaptor subunit [Acidimicrobiales bacterium]